MQEEILLQQQILIGEQNQEQLDSPQHLLHIQPQKVYGDKKLKEQFTAQ